MQLTGYCPTQVRVAIRFLDRLPVAVCLVLTITACGGGSGGSAVSDPGVADDERLVDILEIGRAGHDVPALAAMIVENGMIIEMAAVGERVTGAPERVTAQDKWHLGSITKSMTSTLAAILIEQGILDWDTTIADLLLDDIPTMRNEYHDVSVEQLMSHTGGLPVDITLGPAFSAGDVNDTSPLSMTERRLAWSTDLLEMPPDSSVGSHLYSNANYIVLGAMIEKATGELWEDVLGRELFAPLGMFDTGFGPPGMPGARTQPWGHAAQGGAWLPFDPGSFDADNALSIGPAGTIHSTMQDFSAYVAAHLSGARGNDGLLSAETFARLHMPPPGSNYAAGWVVESNGWAGAPVIWHNGSNGRWFAHTVLAPDHNAAVFVATNSNSRSAVEDLINVMIHRFESRPQ